MPLRRSPAVVVRALDYGEADRIVTFVTPDAGRLTGIAKGAKRSRRRFGAALELFTLVHLTYFEKPVFEMVRLEGADIVAGFAELRRDLARIAHAAYVAEIVGRAVQPREPAWRAFRLLVETLGAIDREPPDESRLRAFELAMLGLLGYRPELRCCARCRRPRPAGGRFRVSVQAGGLLCRACAGDAIPAAASRPAKPAGASGAPSRGVGRQDAAAGAPDLVEVSGALLDRLAAVLEAAGVTDALPALVLEGAEADEARSLLPRFLAAHLGVEARSLGFVERFGREPERLARGEGGA